MTALKRYFALAVVLTTLAWSCVAITSATPATAAGTGVRPDTTVSVACGSFPTGTWGGITLDTAADNTQTAQGVAMVFATPCYLPNGQLNSFDPVGPLSGVTVDFATENYLGVWSQLCDAVTNSQGVASCTAPVQVEEVDGVAQPGGGAVAWSAVMVSSLGANAGSPPEPIAESSDYGRVPGTPSPPPTPPNDDQIQTTSYSWAPGCQQPSNDEQATLGDLLTDGGNCEVVKIESILVGAVFSLAGSFIVGGAANEGLLAAVSTAVNGVRLATVFGGDALYAVTGAVVGSGLPIALQASSAVVAGIGVAYANGSITIGPQQSLAVGSGTTIVNNSVILDQGTVTDGNSQGLGAGTLDNQGTILPSDGGTVTGGSGNGGLLITGNNFTIDFDSAGGSAEAPLQVYAPTVTASDQSLPTPTPPAGYVFRGWSTTDGVSVTDGSNLQSILGSGPVTATLEADYVPAAITVNASPGSTQCNLSTPDCPTIAAALALVNANPAYYAGRDVTIQVGLGTFDETDTIDVPGVNSLTIAGEGDTDTVINGQGTGTDLTVASGAVTIKDLALTGGSGSGPVYGGGGLVVDPGASATLEQTTLSGDTADFGGAAWNDGGTLTIDSSTLSGDSAQTGGAVLASSGTTTLTNDTLTGDTATAGTGGAVQGTDTAQIDLTNDTVAWDSATGGGAGIAASGSDASDFATVQVANSILDGAGCATSNSGTITDAGYNVESDDSCGLGTTSQVNSPDINLQPSLPAPEDASQAPLVLYLSSGSSAASEVPNVDLAAPGTLGCTLATDETGQARPESGQSACDAGAVNLVFYPSSAPVISQVSAGDGQATVWWTRPAANGGLAPESYTVTATDLDNPANGGQTCTVNGLGSWCTVTGLTDGDGYTFAVTADNSFSWDPAGTLIPVGGVSAPSAPSNTVDPAGVPGPPTITGVTPNDGQASVAWSDPTDDGGAPVTDYQVTATDITNPSNGGQTCFAFADDGDTCNVFGLTDGDTYTFSVQAANIAGTGAASAASNPVVPTAAVPGAPTITQVEGGAGSAAVSWTAPTDDGGSAITGYTVTATDTTTPANGGQTCSPPDPTTTTCTITGLTNGDTYTFAVTAQNAIGTGADSQPSGTVTPVAAPGAPTNVGVQSGDGSAAVSWTAPTDDGGSAITGYTVTATDTTTPANGGQTCSPPDPTTTTCTITGLTNGDTYTFTVTASNTAGPGTSASTPSPVTVGASPAAPSGIGVTGGDQQVTVTWTAPTDDGGLPITGYTVTATDTTNPANGGQTCSPPEGTTTTCTVTGLTDGDAYTFTVAAQNAIGTGAPSAPSAVAVPATVPGPPDEVNALPGDGQATVSWSAPGDDGGSTITGYTVTATDLTTPANGGQTCTPVPATATTCTMTGLADGDRYTFAVTATNAVGRGTASQSSLPAVPEANPLIRASVHDAATGRIWTSYETKGAKAYDAASLSESSGDPISTGKVTYRLYADPVCTGTPISAQTVTVSRSGAVPRSANSPALKANTYSYQVAYGGDASHAPATGTCQPFTVVRRLADLAVRLNGPTDVPAGSSFAETITVTNHGPAPATDVDVTLSLPSGATVTSTGGGTVLGSSVVWTTATLLPGHSITYIAHLAVPAPTKKHTARVSAGVLSLKVPDPNSANNLATRSIVVGGT